MFQVDDSERISASYGAVLADRPPRAARGNKTTNTPPFSRPRLPVHTGAATIKSRLRNDTALNR